MTWLSAVSLFCSSSKKLATEVIGLLTLAIRKRWVGVTFSPVCLSSDTKALRVHETPFADSNRKTRHIVFFHERVCSPCHYHTFAVTNLMLADREAAHVVGKTLAIPVRFASVG